MSRVAKLRFSVVAIGEGSPGMIQLGMSELHQWRISVIGVRPAAKCLLANARFRGEEQTGRRREY
jgi:hypothetical protein